MADDLRPPATLDPAKIRELSASWTLAGDAGLLRYLENSAERLMSRVATAEQQLNDSTWEATQATVRFDNVHNQFVALSAKQFFENRIYDEDIPRVTEISNKLAQVKNAKTKAEKEGETLASMREAVSLGCHLVGSHFKRIEIRPQDFDEDDDPTFKPEPIFEPLDPYLVRPLPFLIGSKEFATSKSVGLVEQEQQTTSTVTQQDDDLVIDVGTRVANQPSVVQRPATEAMPALPEKAPSDHSGLYAVSSGSGDSGELFADEHRVTAAASRNDVDSLFNEPIQNAIQPTSSRSIQDELAAKLGLPPNVVSGDRKPLTKTVAPSSAAPKPTAEDSDNDGDIFEAPPPLPQPNRSNLNAPSRKVDNLFETRTGGLFDSDEEDDLFAPPKPRVKGAQTAASSVASKTSVTEQKPLPTQVVSKPAPPPVAAGIFDDAMDEPDDHSDIFAPIPNKTQPPAKTAQASGTASTATPASAVAPSVSSLPKATPKSLFDDDSEEDDIFSAAPRKSEPVTKATKEILPEKSEPSNKSLFPTDPSHPTFKQKPTGGVPVLPSVDRPSTSSTAVKQTDMPSPLADKRDEINVDVHKTVKAETTDHSSTESSSAPSPVISEKQLIPTNPSDKLVVPDIKKPSKPVGGVSVLPHLPAPSIRHETSAAVNKPSEENRKETSAAADMHEPPACPSQPTEKTPSPKRTRFALDDNSDDEDLFSPKGSINSTPSENTRENLANIMVAGLKKNLAQATAASSPPKPTLPSPAVEEPHYKDSADDHQPLESLAKTRAKVPSSSRRPPSRRPLPLAKPSLFESDSDSGEEDGSFAAIQPAVITTGASPVSVEPQPPAQTSSISTSNQGPLPSSIVSNAAQGTKVSTASLKSPLFESDSDNGDDKNKSPPATSKTIATNAVKSPGDKLVEPQPPVQTPSISTSNQRAPPSGVVPNAAQGTKVSAASLKSPLFETDSDNGDDKNKSPPATSKAVATNAAKSPGDKLAQASVPSFQEVPTRVVEKEEPKLAPKSVSNAKASARPGAAALFDSDDDEDIFAPAAVKSATASSGTAAKLPIKPATATASSASGPLFADDDIDDIFAVKTPSNSAKAPVEPSKTSVPVKKSAATNKGALFGDDSDSDLDIFK